MKERGKAIFLIFPGLYSTLLLLLCYRDTGIQGYRDRKGGKTCVGASVQGLNFKLTIRVYWILGRMELKRLLGIEEAPDTRDYRTTRTL